MQVWIELCDHVRSRIHDPDVVLRIDPHPFRPNHAVNILTDLADKGPVLIVLSEPTVTAHERPRRSSGQLDVATSAYNKYMSLGIYRYAGRLTLGQTVRQRLQDVPD